MTTQNTPDVWECPDCGGHGSVERYPEGSDLPHWMTCETCGGTGQCGPGAMKYVDKAVQP